MRIFLILISLIAPANANIITLEFAGTVSGITGGTYNGGHPYSDLNGLHYDATFVFNDAAFVSANLRIDTLPTYNFWSVGGYNPDTIGAWAGSGYQYVRINMGGMNSFQTGPCPGAPCGALGIQSKEISGTQQAALYAVPLGGTLPAILKLLNLR